MTSRMYKPNCRCCGKRFEPMQDKNNPSMNVNWGFICDDCIGSNQIDTTVIPKIIEKIDEMIFINNMYWNEDVSFISNTKRDYYNKSLRELKKRLMKEA